MQVLCQLSYSPGATAVYQCARLRPPDLRPWFAHRSRAHHRPMSEPVVTSEAVSDDVADLQGFFWEAWREAGPDAPGWIGASDAVMSELTSQEAILSRMGGPDRRMFVARHDGDVVGFSATRRIDAAGVELAGVVVLQSVIGRGVGGALLAAAMAGMRADGFEHAVVRTEVDNTWARTFYEHHGFVESDEMVDRVQGVDVDLVELRLDLT